MSPKKSRTNKSTGFKPSTTLEEMLLVKTFDELLADKDVLDVRGMAARTGYDPKHLQRLCRDERIPHITRGVDPTRKEVQFFFLAAQAKSVFEYRKARA